MIWFSQWLEYKKPTNFFLLGDCCEDHNTQSIRPIPTPAQITWQSVFHWHHISCCTSVYIHTLACVHFAHSLVPRPRTRAWERGYACTRWGPIRSYISEEKRLCTLLGDLANVSEDCFREFTSHCDTSYSRKILREKTFTNSEVLWLFKKIFSAKFGVWYLL